MQGAYHGVSSCLNQLPRDIVYPWRFFLLERFHCVSWVNKGWRSPSPSKNPGFGLKKIKELYVGASRLMQDRCNFWVKMSQAGQTSITAWETTVRTAAGRCLLGTNAEEFMRDKFLFGLNEFFPRFREHIFNRDGQRKPDDPPFTLAFVVSQPYHLKRLSKQTSCWQPMLLKNSSIILHPHSQTEASQNPLKDLETDPVFSGIANNNTLVACAQHPEKSAATATKPAISHTFVSRPSEPSDPPVPPPQNPTPPGPSRKAFSMGIVLPSQKNNLLIFLAPQLPHPRFTHLSRTKAISSCLI